MTMTKSVAHHILSGLVRCHACGDVMSAIPESDNHPAGYVCPRLLSHGPTGCANQTVDADILDRLVVAKLLDNVITEENLQDTIALVKRDAVSEAECEIQRLQDTQHELSDLNRQKGTIITAVEHGATTYVESAKRVGEITDVETELESAAREAKERAAASEYAAESEDRIRRYAADLSTYLRESNAAGTREFLHAFIHEVLVAPDAATIRYTVPTATGVNNQIVPL